MDLANTLREERKTAELQALDKSFYQQVGIYLSGLEQELSKIEDYYSVEAQILQDTLKSERGSLTKLIDQRMKKIVRKAVRNARSASKEDTCQGMTREEEDIYRQMLSAIHLGRETILALEEAGKLGHEVVAIGIVDQGLDHLLGALGLALRDDAAQTGDRGQPDRARLVGAIERDGPRAPPLRRRDPCREEPDDSSSGRPGGHAEGLQRSDVSYGPKGHTRCRANRVRLAA